MYETLLTFGTASLDSRLAGGESREDIARTSWSIYFQRAGHACWASGVVDPYVVLDGEILAANPWDGDAELRLCRSTAWYQQALAAPAARSSSPTCIPDAVYRQAR